MRDGVFAMELGGPEVGRGCGGRGIIHGFELLEKLGFHDWDFDYVLLDFLGDVVCGGFGLPIARDMCQKVIVVGSNDLQSLYVANNVCSAVEYFRKLGGNVGVAGMVINKDDGTGEAQAFAEAVGIPVLAAIPRTTTSAARAPTTRSSAGPTANGAPLFEELADNVAEAPPVQPSRSTQDGLLGLFASEAVGRDVVLEPATMADMCGVDARREALARSHLRRGLTTSAWTRLRRPRRQAPTPDAAPRPDVAAGGSGCHAGKARADAAPRRPPARARRSSATPQTIPTGPHDQPQIACARPSARCASACACGAPRPSSRARPAASTG